jgi:NitT/TauT family transport system substrate-binding protein
VRVSWVPSLTIAPLFVAADRGYWQEHGIELQLEQVQSAADAIAFLANGQLDASFGAVAVALYNAVNQGLSPRVVAPSSYERTDRATALVVRKELWDSGAVRRTEDLRGRRIYTVAPGTGAAYVRIKALEKAGLTDSDVDLVSLQLPDVPVAMANGQIDAGLFPEPWSTRVLTDGLAVVLDPAAAPGTLVTTVMAGDRLLHDRSDLGRRFMFAYLRGVRDLQTREQIFGEETVASLARWTGLSPDLIKQLQSVPRWDAKLYIDKDNLLDQQQVFIASGATAYREPLPADRLVDTSLADAAVQQLGRQ